MDNVVITIARQYGSGGKTVGEMLAKEMGIPFYNDNLLKMASEESGISEQLFRQLDEKLKNSLFNRVSLDIYTGELIPPESSDFVSEKNLFNYQAEIIKRLAKTQSCVIIGRAADFILKDYPNVVSVFVHGSKEFNLARAMEYNSMTEEEMKKFIVKTDKYRADYYKHYTGREWTDARNYDLCLNSSKLGFQKCVEEIQAYIKVRF
ncbi:MAG: cytidylate kinase-like family protein [Lachnospiraceae bacterium]|jgi:cytidylate kinase|nr:cytidylate kinase-like family protein [Lachnospiraceae bacterium]MCI9099989.1 cytidylate kinase-like family protein [Lachnospiraceae bacterium]MCI9356910.1 cytidylate kinase-like family protein [Lachnospiraceae bacterium]